MWGRHVHGILDLQRWCWLWEASGLQNRFRLREDITIWNGGNLKLSFSLIVKLLWTVHDVDYTFQIKLSYKSTRSRNFILIFKICLALRFSCRRRNVILDGSSVSPKKHRWQVTWMMFLHLLAWERLHSQLWISLFNQLPPLVVFQVVRLYVPWDMKGRWWLFALVNFRFHVCWYLPLSLLYFTCCSLT